MKKKETKLEKIKPEHLKVLKRIRDSRPQELLDKLEVKKPVIDPVVREIIDRAMVDPEVSQEVKDKYQLIIDGGYLDLMQDDVDEEVTRKIEEYEDREILKAIDRGELPKGKRYKELKAKVKKQK